MTGKQLDELAEELRDRTSDFLQEEAYEMLYDMGYIEELDDDAIDLINGIWMHFFHPTITKHW